MKPLGFIIITYNRPADALALLQNISQLDEAAALLQEIILVNNASTDSYSELKEFINTYTAIPFKYYDAPENLGVAKGRNYALQKSTAPILIMLDDDAVLQNKDALVNLVKEFNNQINDEVRMCICSEFFCGLAERINLRFKNYHY